MCSAKSGVGLPDATPPNPEPGSSKNTSRRREKRGLSVSGSIGPRVRAACSHSTGWPAPGSNAILKSGAKPTPTTHNTPNTSRSAAVLLGAYAGEAGPPHWPLPPLEYPIVFRPSLGCRRVPAQGRTGWSDLSRMKGNFQVRFLEGGGLATARLYSARRQGSRQEAEAGLSRVLEP